MPVFNAILTNQAEDAALDYDNTQIALQITHVGFGTSTAVADPDQLQVLGEVARVPVAGGGIEPNSHTLTANVIWTPDQVRDIGQIGFYAGDTLFCIYATGQVSVRVTPDVGIAASFAVSLVRLPNGSVNIVVDDSLSPLMLLLGQHQADPNPHPQYAMDAQNNLEHTNLLALIQAANQRIADLELREEIQIGEFVITDDPRNPATYKGYGHFRLVPDVLLKGLPSGGTAGQYSQVSTGSGHQVRTTFFWQRFDPDLVSPLRTILIDQDMTDVNLLDLFVATYGAPAEGERVKFIVAEDVLITASTTSNYALITDNWPPSTELSMDVLGVVAGRGGDGGWGGGGYQLDGGSWSRVPPDPMSGMDGGNAILATYPLALNNQGIVAGGGGGGGAAGWCWIVAGENKWNGVTPGGGGLPFGQHGSYREAYGSPESFAHPPTDATATMVGLGGLQRDDHGAAYLKKGGDGGSWGENGQAGEQPASSREVDGQPGGLAGIAITGLVTVTGNPVLGN